MTTMPPHDSAKRRREAEPVIEDVLHYGRLIMHNDPFKERAPKEENRAFRALFGCGANIILIIWKALLYYDILPKDGTITHLLWTLMYLKTNASWKTMTKLTGGTDPKTLRKWVFDSFLPALSDLEPWVIDWTRRHQNDIFNDCLVSVDGVDFQIPFLGRKFHSHKYKQGSALRYEVALCILTGEIVWINGPYEPGIWNDIQIFRNALKSMLDLGERVEADDGYRGESPRYVKCPKSIGQNDLTEQMQAYVRRRQETVNKRFKQWCILKHVYRHDIKHHGKVFRAVAIITQISIQNGEPLFSVEYEDPDFDNNYFDEENDAEDVSI